MKRFLLLAAGVLWLGALQARAGLEGRVDMVLDPDSNDESPVGGMIGLGVPLTERWTVGGYGSLVTTDRDLPRTMGNMYGIGAFAEFDLSEGYALMPFVGARAGLLDTDGAGYDTAGLLAGTAGLKYHFNDRFTAAIAVSYLWASEDYFDYDRKTPVAPEDAFYTADDTDLTVDVGVRWMF